MCKSMCPEFQDGHGYGAILLRFGMPAHYATQGPGPVPTASLWREYVYFLSA